MTDDEKLRDAGVIDEPQPDVYTRVPPEPKLDTKVTPTPHPYTPGKEQAGPVPTRTGAVPKRQVRRG